MRPSRVGVFLRLDTSLKGLHEQQSGGNGDATPRPSGDVFTVVGLGASAGGIRALREFRARVPAGGGPPRREEGG